jgi:hypothetical protein
MSDTSKMQNRQEDTGPSAQDRQRSWAVAVINTIRLADDANLYVTRYCLLSSPEEMEQDGIEIVALAQALAEGLDTREFDQALQNGFQPEMYPELSARVSGTEIGIERINQVLRHFNKHHEETAPIMRSLERRC